MSAIDPNFRWHKAKGYRLESIEWLLTKLESEEEALSERMTQLAQQNEALLSDEGLTEQQRSVSDQWDVANDERDWLRHEIEGLDADLRNKSKLSYWRRFVIVAEGEVTEFAPPQANLAEFLFKQMDLHLGKETAVADIAMAFASHYGHLRHGPQEWYTLLQWRSDLNALSDIRKRVSNAGSNDVEIEKLTAVFTQNPATGRPQIVFRPDDLFSLIALQFSILVSGGAKMDNCRECGRPFFHGGASDRREGALYCDDVCRERHKTKQRILARQATSAKSKKKKGR
jgi:hypothetical protein